MKNQLFEEITKEYSLQILKWAYKKCGDSDRAEELTQEVMAQIFSAIQKSVAEGKRIEQVEHFVWKIARYVWCHSLRKSTRYVMCPLEEDLRDESDFAGELAEREEQKQMLAQLRKQVSRLPFVQSLYAMEYVTSLLAFKDNLLYVPKDSAEGEFLTLKYVEREK